MINNSLSRWYVGYLVVEIQGNGNERFLNLCTNKGVYLYNIEKHGGKIKFSIDINSYKNLGRIVRKTHIVPKIIGKYGWPFLVMKARKRKSFYMGMFLGIVIFYLCSLFVWDIKVEGDNYYTDHELIQYLDTKNIRQGMLIKDIVCKNIEDDIRNKYKDIGWVSAQVKGTRLIISIKENIKFNKTNVKEVPRHIVASVDGIVKKIVVRKGESKVALGQEVKKGQVLVSGVMDIVNDVGETIKKNGVYASADISIQSDREYFFSKKRKYKKKIYTDKKKTKLEMVWCKKDVFKIWPIISLKKFDNYDVLVNNYNVSLGQNLEVPMEFIRYIECEYKENIDLYSDKELINIADEYFNRYKEELKSENVAIIDSSIDNYLDDTSLYSKGYVTLQYNDMDYKRVEKKELFVEKVKEDKENN